MPRISSLAAVAALAASALAAPASQASVPATNGFSIAQVPGPQYYKSGPAQVLKTYAKFNATVPASTVSNLRVAAAQQSGSVSANPESYDQSYLCPVKVGSQVSFAQTA